MAPRTEVEEVVATCAPPNNGAGPLWCYGAPLIVRRGEDVFASVMETGEGVPPLCNTRWRLFHRGADGWRPVWAAEGFREREPCPLVLLPPGRLFLSVNPSTQPPGTEYGTCDPHLLEFTIERLEAEPDRRPKSGVPVRPPWEGAAHFTDHSYRGVAADARRGELLLLNIDARSGEQHWAYRDCEGRFVRTGKIAFPIRACYPQAALRDGAAHVLAIGDIVEPREEWRAYKKEKTGAAWDYVFRRLFYATTPQIGRAPFSAPIEVESVEETGGHILNLDLWLDPSGAAHLLYLKTNTTPLLRDRFFPGQKVVTTLEHVQVPGGKVTTLLEGGEDKPQTPRYARFHATPDGALWVVVAVSRRDGDGRALLENRVQSVWPRRGEASVLALREPFSTFFTAAERGGSAPSDRLDLFGVGGDARTLRYARVRLR